MNFDHWKEAEASVVGAPLSEPARAQNVSMGEPRRAGGRRSAAGEIPIARAYTRMPRGSRKAGAKFGVFMAPAPSGGSGGVSAQAPHFVASDPAPDMDLAFANIDRNIE